MTSIRAAAPWPLVRDGATRLLLFGWAQARACAFAVGVFAGLALTAAVPLPIPRYDALLLYGVALTAAFWALRLETGREVLAILGFHAVGLALELFKVHVGSWAYPEDAWTKVGGVPLYSGFMYAAVGSYVVRAWRLLDLGLTGYRPVATTAVAVLVYANFFTHHWLPDVRVWLAVALVAATWRTRVHFTVGRERHRMPLSLSFLLIGLFLWIAENVSTLLGAWRYPHQEQAWEMVHVSKLGAWSLLVVVSFVLVATWRHGLGRSSPGEAEVHRPSHEPKRSGGSKGHRLTRPAPGDVGGHGDPLA